jgi:hypothetical protein
MTRKAYENLQAPAPLVDNACIDYAPSGTREGAGHERAGQRP